MQKKKASIQIGGGGGFQGEITPRVRLVLEPRYAERPFDIILCRPLRFNIGCDLPMNPFTWIGITYLGSIWILIGVPQNELHPRASYPAKLDLSLCCLFSSACLFIHGSLHHPTITEGESTTPACQRRRWRQGYGAPPKSPSDFLVGELNFRDFFRAFMLFCLRHAIPARCVETGPHQGDVWRPLPPSCHGCGHRAFQAFLGLCCLHCRVLKCH